MRRSAVRIRSGPQKFFNRRECAKEVEMSDKNSKVELAHELVEANSRNRVAQTDLAAAKFGAEKAATANVEAQAALEQATKVAEKAARDLVAAEARLEVVPEKPAENPGQKKLGFPAEPPQPPLDMPDYPPDLKETPVESGDFVPPDMHESPDEPNESVPPSIPESDEEPPLDMPGQPH